MLAFLHQRFGIALLAYAAVLGLWGGYLFIRHRALSGGWRSSYLLMLGLTVLQGLIGVAAFAGGGRPREILHVVYGIFAVLFLPGVYFWAGKRRPDTEAAILATSAWVVAIAYGRGILTGGG